MYDLSEAEKLLDSICYMQGCEAKKNKDYELAVKWMRIAARKGHVGAMTGMSMFYSNGEGVEADPRKSTMWKARAASYGDSTAIVSLAYAFLLGGGVEKNLRTAVKLCQAGIDIKPEEYNKLTLKSLLKEMKEAHIAPAPEKGTRAFGIAFAKKLAEELDDELTALKELAAQGDGIAMFRLGERYYNNEYNQGDISKAADWYWQAANQGVAEAQFRMGLLHYNGEGLTYNRVQALKWFLAAAGSGLKEAQMNAGVMYYVGDGVPVNKNDAFLWFSHAAKRGLPEAMYALGAMCLDGAKTTNLLKTAYDWLSEAATLGSQPARVVLAKTIAMLDYGEEDSNFKVPQPEMVSTFSELPYAD